MIKQIAKKVSQYLFPELFQLRKEIREIREIKPEVLNVAYELLMTEALALDPNWKFPVFIYQMGKVGSCTIHATLLSNKIESIHVHCLTPQLWSLHEACSPEWGRKMKYAKVEAAKYRYLLEKRRSQSDKISIITMAREPISLLVSGLFEFLPQLGDGKKLVALYQRKPEKAIEKMTELFLKEVDVYMETIKRPELKQDINLSLRTRKSLRNHFWTVFETPTKWFDLEMCTVFNFDVYRQDLKLHSQGYDTCEFNNTKILILRFEDMFKNLDLADILSAFLGQEIKSIVSANKTSEKGGIYEFYRAFRSRIKFPMEFLELQYNTQYSQYFYSDEERAGFLEKWKA